MFSAERHGERDDDDRQEVRRAEDEPGAKAHEPGSKRKPTPRTVWMYRGRRGIVSELLAQRAHVDVERLRRAEPGRIPDLVDDLVAAHDLARALEQDAQELEQAEVLDDDVGLGGEPADDVAPRRCRMSTAIERLPAVADEVQRAHPVHRDADPAGDVADARPLDLDHLGALVGEQRGRVRAR